MCFLGDLSEDSAIKTLQTAQLVLDSGEVGNPPHKFKKVYKMADNLGLKLVAHVGEEAGSDYIYIRSPVRVRRIDHDVQYLNLVERRNIPLTTCPSKLKVYEHYFNGENIMKRLLDKGLKVTMNSDDPPYFGGYITDIFLKVVV